jgi:hypothetical protein
VEPSQPARTPACLPGRIILIIFCKLFRLSVCKTRVSLSVSPQANSFSFYDSWFYLFISPSAHMSVNLSICVCVFLSIYQFFSPSVCVSNCLSICLSLCTSVRLYLYLSILLSVSPFVCLSFCPSLLLYVCHYVCVPSVHKSL